MLVELTVDRNSKKFGWGWSCTPTGEDAYSIEYPGAPDYEGTIEQVKKARSDDRAFHSLGGAFYNTAWFYDGNRITHTWCFDCVADHNDPSEEYDFDKREYGYTWTSGFGGTDAVNKGKIKIRVEVDESRPMGLTALAELSGIQRNTLYQAALAGRLETTNKRPYLSTLEMVGRYKETLVLKPRK